MRHSNNSEYRYLLSICSARIYDVAQVTPLTRAERLSRQVGNSVLLKREDMQPGHSFKVRGAYNKLAKLPAADRASGVATASTGNHAYGVALAARHFGCSALIVMPSTTPAAKIEAVSMQGAEIVVHGDRFAEAYMHALELAQRRSLTFIHPFDDPDVIAGQGTVALEMLQQVQGPLDAVFVPVGGGALLAGVATYIKSVRPGVKVIGVQTRECDAMVRSLKFGSVIGIEDVGVFSDGTAIKQVGHEPFRLARKFVDEMVLVDTDEVCAAIQDIFEDTRSVVEPAGALAVAGLKQCVANKQVSDQTLVAVTSGANICFDRLGFIAQRSALGAKREMLICVQAQEKPGMLRQLVSLLREHNITEINYRWRNGKTAVLILGLATASEKDRHWVEALLSLSGFHTKDLTYNEIAKSHLRCVPNGCVPDGGEHVFHLQFPERPQALFSLMQRFSDTWDISLLNYRRDGGHIGSVLLGLRAQSCSFADVSRILDDAGLSYTRQDHNDAYRILLQGTRR